MSVYFLLEFRSLYARACQKKENIYDWQVVKYIFKMQSLNAILDFFYFHKQTWS